MKISSSGLILNHEGIKKVKKNLRKSVFENPCYPRSLAFSLEHASYFLTFHFLYCFKICVNRRLKICFIRVPPAPLMER